MGTLALAGLAAVPACASPAAPQAGAVAPVQLAVVPAERRPVERSYEVSGTVRGRNTAVVTSHVLGDLREVRVRAGELVRAGQVLATLDDAEARAAVQRARAELDAATAARRQAQEGARASEATAGLASVTHARMKGLLAAGAATRQAYDDAAARDQAAAAARDLATAAIAGGDARIEAARAALAGAEAALGYTRVTAPFAGRIIERRVDPGSQAAPGTPLLVVEQEGALRVEAAVDESRAGAVAVGAPVRVALEALDREVDGRVSEIVPAVDPASRAFTVKVELPADLGPALRPGMFARLRFPQGADQRLTVPVGALRMNGDLDRLFVLEDGRARMRLVTIGAQRDGRAEVLSGLEPGERVVTAPPAELLDGTPAEARP